MSPQANLEIHPRGVYEALYVVDGRPVFFAVTSRGERFRQVVLTGAAPEDDVIAWLWRELDRVDPVPQLALVRNEPKPPQPTAERLAALYRDADRVRALSAQRRRERVLPASPGWNGWYRTPG